MHASFMTQQNLRNAFLDVIGHICDLLTKVTKNTGQSVIIADLDLHTIAEGLFLFAWTHWEQFTHELLIEDLATTAASALNSDVQQFASTDAPRRLANRL